VCFSKGRDLYVFLQAYQRSEPTMPAAGGVRQLLSRRVKVFETAPLAVTGGLDARTKAIPLRFSLPSPAFRPAVMTAR